MVIQLHNTIHQPQLQQAPICLDHCCHHHLYMISQGLVQLSSSNQPIPCPQPLSLHLSFTQHRSGTTTHPVSVYQTTQSPNSLKRSTCGDSGLSPTDD